MNGHPSAAVPAVPATMQLTLQLQPGLTSLELAARMQRDRWTVARRLPELTPIYARRGEVERGEFRIVNGRRHVCWWPVESRAP